VDAPCWIASGVNLSRKPLFITPVGNPWETAAGETPVETPCETHLGDSRGGKYFWNPLGAALVGHPCGTTPLVTPLEDKTWVTIVGGPRLRDSPCDLAWLNNNRGICSGDPSCRIPVETTIDDPLLGTNSVRQTMGDHNGEKALGDRIWSPPWGTPQGVKPYVVTTDSTLLQRTNPRGDTNFLARTRGPAWGTAAGDIIVHLSLGPPMKISNLNTHGEPALGNQLARTRGRSPLGDFVLGTAIGDPLWGTTLRETPMGDTHWLTY
jgi:hypothetical protein